MSRRRVAARRPKSADRERFMRLAIRLARLGLEGVSPNPLVGAVVVRRGRVIATGFHRRFGGPHAEVEALRRAGVARGADLYVNLEPCGHHGKTPPCAAAIAAARVGRVFYAVRDAHPATRGKGPRYLAARGIEVREGLLREEARRLNAPFFHWVATGMPWVILKWAMTLDGKTASAAGESRWITGGSARAFTHSLRRRVDAILAGTETILRDDPHLGPRPPRGRRPLRVILDRRGRLPLGLRLLARDPAQDRAGPRLYVTSRAAGARRRRLLAARGLEVLVLPATRAGIDLRALLRALGRRGVSQLLVEGGASLAGSFLDQALVQEVAALIAPRLLGGARATGALGGRGLAALARTPWLEAPAVRKLGEDLLVHGRIRAARRRARGRPGPLAAGG
jgi:diaminohydroxyphosphoribosylaminopyrimidine deaminase/5-amino-6-(5-phosphoribosylamino)uracil reductase